MKSLLTVRFILPLLLLALCKATAGQVLSTGEPVDSFVRDHIETHSVMVFAKSYCPHCRRTKQLLENEYTSYDSKIINLDQLAESDGPVIQKYLLELTGQRTVPNIFIHQQHIGGNSDLQKLHASGKVNEMLSGAQQSDEL